MATTERSYQIAVLDRALDVLEALEQADTPLGTTELARRLGTTKSAAFRILVTLEQRGYVTKDPATTRYSLGARLASLGERALRGIDLRHVARPTLERLHHAFQETVNLGIPEGSEIVYIDMVESSHGLRMAARIGSHHPAHSTALGKVMLAFLPSAEVARLLPERLPPRTGRTITDRGALLDTLRAVRASGTAHERGENEDGARCIGVPIFDPRGWPVAAISVSGPETRIDDDRAAEIGRALRGAAREITRAIGGAWPDNITEE